MKLAMYNNQDHRTYKVVQILKKNFMEESPESDGDGGGAPLTGTAHTKTKKSLFATLIKRRHLKNPKMKITKKIETCSTINIETDDALSEQELAQYQLSAESEQYYPPKAVSEVSVQTPKFRKSSFFQKMVKKSKFDKHSGDHAGDVGDCEKCDQRILAHLSTLAPTTYMPKYNVKLINGIHELLEILQNLHQSEEHMIYLMKKYIEDANFQKQLMKASVEYFALQYDAKSHTNTLASGMWLQQLDTAKIQEYNTQMKMNFLIKANRSLQFQVENLSRHCEKLADRTNLYPKRFLHMRSIGKTYARNLIENNRKLQNKLKALTGVITDFEEEMQKLQQQKTILEEEKRNFKTQIYKLEGILERNVSDHEMEKAALIARISNQNRLIQDSEQASRYLFQDLIGFEHQARDMAIMIEGPNFAYQDACLPELIYQTRAYVGELLTVLLAAYASVIAVAKDVNQLRNTNARLQENLQKSTNELDNLSKKLEKTTSTSSTSLEIKYYNLQQENYNLKLKLESSVEEKLKLQEETETQKKLLNESNAALNESKAENLSISNKINEVFQVMVQLGETEISAESTNQEKLEYMRLRYIQAGTDRKLLSETNNNLEEENQNFLQNQQMYQQDLNTLQEAITMLSSENEVFKKQAATEHQTVITLQNERVKYLEEKNILKTVFQHLKSEVARIQQLEGAVSEMTKETNRLALVAEFNKQLGEQLKNEVEIRENTIIELRHNLEKLSHIQIDNDKEKISLCARLSEISNVKDKLSDCLEMELKKNLHLDETKKKLESSTKSQMKIYEEMQKNERAALKELLKDFKSLIKQRDSLLQLQEQNKKKIHEIEKQHGELRRDYNNALEQINEKDADMKELKEKLEELEEQCRKLDEENHINNAKYDKTIRKYEKLLAQLRSEKGELETSTTYLKTNVQKIQDNLDEARKKEKEALNQLGTKSAEISILETELSSYKNNLQTLNQENGKMKIEIQYLEKMLDDQKADLSNIKQQFSSKDSMFLETQSSVTNKEQQISQLSRVVFEMENKIKLMEQEYTVLKKQNDDQNKIMCGYENQLVMLQDVEATKLKLEKELFNIQLEQKSTQVDLDNARKEIENLRNELQVQIVKNEKDKKFYKSQASEIILEYDEQKMNIEEEIDIVSTQLSKVTESLQSEKSRFDELSKSYEELKENFIKMKGSLSDEVKAHQETCRKLEETDKVLKTLGDEKENLERQIHLLMVEINEEKDINLNLSTENKKIQMIFEQGRQQYGVLLTTNASLAGEVKDLQYEIKNLMDSKERSENDANTRRMQLEEKTADLNERKDTIECLKQELAESQNRLFDLKEECFKLQQQVTGLEFKNCELTLQIHEAQGRLETERNLFNDLKSHEDNSTVEPSEGGELFY